MSTDKRFDEEILDTAQTLASSVLAHKEVRSVVVLIDWQLPAKIAAELPLGVINVGAPEHGMAALVGLMTQNTQLTHELLRRCVERAEFCRQQAETPAKDNG